VIAAIKEDKVGKMIETYKGQTIIGGGYQDHQNWATAGLSGGASLQSQEWMQNQNIHLPTITTAQTYPTQSFQANTLSKR
jgi:hypothetical protein